jgi:hypothetical protein
MRTVILFGIGYALLWWGSTLLFGGPNNTGSWPFLCAMLKWGNNCPPKPIARTQNLNTGTDQTVTL